jgi:hypothetical protein
MSLSSSLVGSTRGTRHILAVTVFGNMPYFITPIAGSSFLPKYTVLQGVVTMAISTIWLHRGPSGMYINFHCCKKWRGSGRSGIRKWLINPVDIMFEVF